MPSCQYCGLDKGSDHPREFWYVVRFQKLRYTAPQQCFANHSLYLASGVELGSKLTETLKDATFYSEYGDAKQAVNFVNAYGPNRMRERDIGPEPFVEAGKIARIILCCVGDRHATLLD